MRNLEPRRIKPRLLEYISSLEKKMCAIDANRRELLEQAARFIREKKHAGEIARLTFICTYNSRRSHFAQAWGQAAAYCFGVKGVECYSGGMKAATANPRAISALQRAGFKVEMAMNGPNPQYRLIFAEGEMPVIAFSKVYDAPVNPSEGFAAVIACAQADENCPAIPGAEMRIALPYEDPRLSDDSPEETAAYDESCRQIATEMCYIFQSV